MLSQYLRTHVFILLFSGLLLNTSQSATVVYSLADRLTSGDGLSVDQWSGDAISGWKASQFNGLLYTRNNNQDGMARIQRLNNNDFSYSLAPSITSISIEYQARVASNKYVEMGLYSSSLGPTTSGDIIGWGYYKDSISEYHLNINGVKTWMGTYSGSAESIIRIDYDRLANTARLFVDESQLGGEISAAANTPSDILSVNGLYVTTPSRFAGLGTVSITTVPEPSGMALLGLIGFLASFKRQREGN